MTGYQILNLLRYKREKSILKESVINTAAQKTRMSFIFVVTRMDTPKSGIRSETGTE